MGGVEEEAEDGGDGEAEEREGETGREEDGAGVGVVFE